MSYDAENPYASPSGEQSLPEADARLVMKWGENLQKAISFVGTNRSEELSPWLDTLVANEGPAAIDKLIELATVEEARLRKVYQDAQPGFFSGIFVEPTPLHQTTWGRQIDTLETLMNHLVEYKRTRSSGG